MQEKNTIYSIFLSNHYYLLCFRVIMASVLLGEESKMIYTVGALPISTDTS